jgi:hypothetical protein
VFASNLRAALLAPPLRDVRILGEIQAMAYCVSVLLACIAATHSLSRNTLDRYSVNARPLPVSLLCHAHMQKEQQMMLYKAVCACTHFARA